MAYKTIIGTMKTAGTLDISTGDIGLPNLSVDNADLAGSIANAKLANSAVTVTAGDGLSGGGSVSLGGSVSVAVDLNELTEAALAVDEDYIVFIDNDGNASRKEAFSDAISAVAKSNYGLAAGAGQLALSSSALAAATVAVGADTFLFYDADGSPKNESFSDLATAFAGDGLKAASGVLALDANELTAAAVDRANDSFVLIDATDNSTKKESIADLAAAFADGDGIEASSGKLSVKVDDTTVEINSDTVRIKDNGVSLAKMAGLARGKFIYGDASGDPAALAVGSAHQFLQADGTDLAWVSLSGDVTLAAGVASIGATKVTDAMMNDDVASGMAGSGLGASSGVLAVQVSGAVVLASDKAGISGSIAGDGLTYAGGVNSISALSLDLSEYSRVDVAAADHFLMLDSDGSNVQLERTDKLANFMAGDGLEQSSGVLAVKVDDSSIEIDSDTVRVKAVGVTNAMLAGSIVNAKLSNSTITVGSTSTSLGGTSTAFSGLTGLDFTAADASIAASLGANTLTIGGGSSHVKIAGDLQVVGTLETVSATDLRVEDLTIEVARGAANSSAADGAGLKIDGADKSLTWSDSDSAFKFDADLYAAAGLTGRLHAITANTTLTQNHFLVKCSTAGGAFTVTLPSSMPTGKVFVIKDAGAAGTNAITIATAGSETIDGAASIQIISNYGAANLMFDGSNYLVW